MATPLDLGTRSGAIAAATSDRLELVVVGGGIVGCGVAVDAASRGLSIALVERDDFGAGASGSSSKLVHGGLRYLAQLDLRLVREALRERAILLANAPHLVSPVRFLYPLSRRRFEHAYVRAGLVLYDALGDRPASLARHRRLDREQLGEIAPALRSTFVKGYEFSDATVDDARLTMTLARTAATLGAHVASRVEATGILREGGRVAGIRARDRLTGEELMIRARHVVCAVGAETELLERKLGLASRARTAPSKGSHIVIPRERIDSRAALITRTAESVLLIVPWNGLWLLGTTDTPWSDPRRPPTATIDDMGYLIDQANRVLADPLTPADVVAGYAGIRPLVAADSAQTAKLSREHAVVRVDDGLVFVVGGKLTTYRVMARDAVDAALGKRRGRRDSITAELRLVGAGRSTVGLSTVPESVADRLRGRYGSFVGEVLAPAKVDPTLLDPIPGAASYIRAEALYAVTHEGALDLADILLRRTHIAIETRDHGLRAAEAIAPLVARSLAWDTAVVEHELASYRSRVATDELLPTMRSAKLTARRSISSAS